MTMVFYIIIAVFATSSILEAWFHEGGIFENVRNNISLWLLKAHEPIKGFKPLIPHESPEPITRVIIIKKELGERCVQLLHCRKCLTYWIAAGSFLLILISTRYTYTAFILYLFIILAIVRGVHLIDGYLAVDDET